MAVARIGISGWTYPPWRGVFYPKGLPHRQELTYAAERLTSIEINGSFYSLQRPESYQAWRALTPPGFVFALKGGRFITHMKKLRDIETALPNFFASGLLALREKLGPILWQLPPNLGFDAGRIQAFLAALPGSTGEAAALADKHDNRLDGRAFTTTDEDRPMRHAVEVRHPSFETLEFIELLRAHGVGLVVADTAGIWPMLFDVTSDFVYVRLHGDDELYVSGYTESALGTWSARLRGWLTGGPVEGRTIAPPADPMPRDVFTYFDNDVKVRAPFDAMALIDLVGRDAARH